MTPQGRMAPRAHHLDLSRPTLPEHPLPNAYLVLLLTLNTQIIPSGSPENQNTTKRILAKMNLKCGNSNLFKLKAHYSQ